MIVAIDAVARQAGDLEHLALDVALGGLDAVDHGLGLYLAKLELVLVDLDDLVGVEHVVIGARCTVPARWARLITGVERAWIDRVDDDAVVAGGDEIVDRCDLRRRIVADRNHLEFGELGLVFRARAPGLGREDGGEPPVVADIAVDQRDLVGWLLGGILDGLGVVGRRAKHSGR